VKKKTNKVLRALQGLFDRARRKRKVKVKHVKKIIVVLERRERAIIKRLESEKVKSKIKQLSNELDIIKAQRQKRKKLAQGLAGEKEIATRFCGSLSGSVLFMAVNLMDWY